MGEKSDWKDNTVCKDRTECFDDYFPCRKEKCKLKHIINWFNLFTDYHNKRWLLKLTEPSDMRTSYYSWPIQQITALVLMDIEHIWL